MKDIVFHIGFHKTGTTWLQKQYFSNPNYFHVINNYAQPWNDELMQNIINVDSFSFNIEKVKEFITTRSSKELINVITAERLSGHPISGAYDAKDIAYRLNKIEPKAKVIVTTREPKSFIVSVYKQMVREGFCGSSHDFLFKNNWKTSNRSRSYFLQEEIINTYKSVFGKDNVLILSFNEFKKDKKTYISKIESFLNIKTSTIKDEKDTLINEAFSNKRMRTIQKLNKFRKTEYNPYPIINIGRKGVFFLSKLFAFLFSNKPIINNNNLDNYLNAKN